MSNPGAAVLGIAVLLFSSSVVSVVRVAGQSAPADRTPSAASSAPASRRPADVRPAVVPAPATASATAEQQKAVIDRYCVTCHSTRVKTANLSLQDVDYTRVGEHAELWEKVVRKLRAGVMPPPDVPRPSLAEYEGVRDWLEAELDRRAAKVSPGAVVLHRLNRTEYAQRDSRSPRPRDRRHDAAAA